LFISGIFISSFAYIPNALKNDSRQTIGQLGTHSKPIHIVWGLS